MARFVLVHGAFGGAWCWDPVVEALERDGHRAIAIDLPGGGEDQTPVGQVTLDAYGERIRDVLAAQDGPSILVGHSMGGVAITHGAAMCPELVSLLVYVAAFMPGDGQSLIDMTRLPEAAGDVVQANLVVEGDPPVGSLSEGAYGDGLMCCCTPEQIEWSTARRRPQSLVPMTQPVSVGDALDGVPRAYVFTAQDHAIRPALQRRMIAEHPCVDVVELDTDHTPALSATAALVGALERFAGLVGAPA
jgi:pimeloyl-ACP methyl ester carboxylesterase